MHLVADLHVHTVSSGHAYSTILENARVAADKGLAIIGMTDHGPQMPGAPHYYHFGNLKALPDEIYGVRILKGIEANIMDSDGTLDLDEERLSKLDIVLAGLHTFCAPQGSTAENTVMMINAMKNPFVDVIVHPGNPEFPVDEQAIVEAAVKYDVALEINNSSLTVSRKGSEERCANIARLAKVHGAKIIVATDSHFACTIGEFSSAVELLNRCGITQEQVLNTSTQGVINHLKRRGRDWL